MARPKRKQLKFDEDSVNKLLQEIYDESHNIKAEITRLYNEWETKIKEPGEIQAFGSEIIKLIGAKAKNQEQKIMILKYLKEVVFAKNTGTAVPESSDDEITSDKRNELIKMINEKLDNKETK